MAPPPQEHSAGRPAPPVARATTRLTEPLTQRELDVVRLVARGHTNEEVAAGLYVTPATVKTHLGNIQRKLAARNRVEIAAWAAWEAGVCTGRG
ncbi:hypothetical protein Srufu_070060 [Streptomyces libani subsp. rufus]|nr:hypothetical protein Srufu_070060 [Streptomyces libani subsp. rufus]